MAPEQKGCRQESFGAKNQLLINKLLTEDCKTWDKNLKMAWVDYHKAYDSVPQLLALLPTDAYDQSSLVQVSVTCDEELEVISGALNRKQYNQDKAYADQKGYFQADSLSPFLFCMALNLLSKELNRTGYGY